MKLALGEHVIDCTDHTAIMGILNVSDDSPVTTSIAGAGDARERALALVAEGAEIIDVGAHSTAAGKRDISPQEEIERVCPVIEALASEGVPTSVDTWTAEVARAAAEAGANLLNDVTGFSDPAMVAVAGEYGLAACVMHMRGKPKLHWEVDQSYDDIATEVREFLLKSAVTLEQAGAGQVWIDPGFAFGKSPQDNVRMLRDVPNLVATGYPVLISASRKGFLSQLLGRSDDQHAQGILEATIAFNTLAANMGAHIVRVHDIAAIADAITIVDAVRASARDRATG
jgi:dihydropteroate synthase